MTDLSDLTQPKKSEDTLIQIDTKDPRDLIAHAERVALERGLKAYINMMPAIGYDHDKGKWVAPWELTVGGEHPQAYFSLETEAFRTHEESKKRWGEAHNNLVEAYQKDEARKESLDTQEAEPSE